MGRYTHSTGWGLIRLPHARRLDRKIDEALRDISISSNALAAVGTAPPPKQRAEQKESGLESSSKYSEAHPEPVPGRSVTDREPLLAALGVELHDELLTLALTDRSFAYENGDLPTNERLELLGDAVLGMVVTERLYREYPNLSEGRLAKLRAGLVNMHTLGGVAAGLGPDGLGAYLYLGSAAELAGGRTKMSILADATEAVLGAVYLHHGLETTRNVVYQLFDRAGLFELAKLSVL
jgi:dsRNA-specific ribonuclease